MSTKQARIMTYDHANKRAMIVAASMMIFAIVFSLALQIWGLHRGHPIPVVMTAPLILCLVPILVALKPRWQLTPEALLDLRKKTRVPYALIEDVRLIKSCRNGAKVFAISAAGQISKVDVLQGDAFAKDLGARIGAGVTNVE